MLIVFNKLQVAILLLAVCTGTTIAVAQEMKTYTNQENNFSFKYPEEWSGPSLGTYTDTEVNASMFGFSKTVEIRPQESTSVDMSVEVDKFPSKRTLKEYTSALEKLKESPGVLSYNKVQEYSTVFKGINATVRVFTLAIGDGMGTRKVKNVMFIRDNIGYKIELQAPLSFYDPNEPIFEKVLESFNFLPSSVLITTISTPSPTPIPTFTSTPMTTPNLTEMTPAPKNAGFEIGLGIAGILAVAHIVKKFGQRKQR